MKIYVILAVALCALCIPSAYSQGTATAEKAIRFYVDQAAFKNLGDAGKTYQEIYVSVDNSQLEYMEKGGKYLGAYGFLAAISHTGGNEVARKEWETIKQFESLDQAGSTFSLEVAGFLLNPGVYDLEIVIRDLSSKKSEAQRQQLSVPSFEGEALQLSEIELARSIDRSKVQSKFVKNTYEVVPNPSRIFGIESPFIYSYSEIYNLNSAALTTGQYEKEYTIVALNGTVVKSAKKTSVIKSDNAFWVDKINTIDVASGKYTLTLKVTDTSTEAAAERSAIIWVSNPNKGSLLAESAAVDTNEVKEFRDIMAYIVREDELRNFDEMNLQGKVQFMNNFWLSLSPEYRREHLQRYYTSQQRFATQLIEGWRTDRGRIYIMYGPPDELAREPASIDTRSYEIWTYETIKDQGQVEFVFVDYGIGGYYQLVHSTIRGGQRNEIYNENWREEIKITR